MLQTLLINKNKCKLKGRAFYKNTKGNLKVEFFEKDSNKFLVVQPIANFVIVFSRWRDGIVCEVVGRAITQEE